ncbi:MAG: hypothetical protein V8S27_00225 [Lachnospiraceae bacterium]
MFFIMGISQGEKKLNFDQTIMCNHCGQYGHLEVYMIYSYLSLFFIPIFKWIAVLCKDNVLWRICGTGCRTWTPD